MNQRKFKPGDRIRVKGYDNTDAIVIKNHGLSKTMTYDLIDVYVDTHKNEWSIFTRQASDGFVFNEDY